MIIKGWSRVIWSFKIYFDVNIVLTCYCKRNQWAWVRSESCSLHRTSLLLLAHNWNRAVSNNNINRQISVKFARARNLLQWLMTIWYLLYKKLKKLAIQFRVKSVGIFVLINNFKIQIQHFYQIYCKKCLPHKLLPALTVKSMNY